VAEEDKDGLYLNDAAYQMAKSDLELPLALDYARKAVRVAEKESSTISLGSLKVEDLREVFHLAAYWDTLGWVNERMSNMEDAERYLEASWKMTQDGVVAGHLCHLYKRVHKTVAAVQMCRAALYRIPQSRGLDRAESSEEMAAAKENLGKLNRTQERNTLTDASNFVTQERTFKLPRFLGSTGSAEFFVLLGSDGRSKTFTVDDVKFISGSDKMKAQGKQLRKIDFKVPAGEGVARVVRRGILGCYQYSGCAFVLMDPASVQSLE
jgi:hypothetical protein